MNTTNINDLKILKYVTQVIPAEDILAYITSVGDIDTLKDLGLITRSVPTEVIAEEIGLVTGFTFSITATPADATVVINGEGRTSLTADEGTEITWSVSKSGYASQSGTYILNADHTETVILEPDYSLMYFTVKALGTGNILFGGSSYCSDEACFDYKLNNQEWITPQIDPSDPSDDCATIAVNEGDIIQFRSTSISMGSSHNTSILGESTVDYEVYGNILSLEWGDDFVGKEPTGWYGWDFYCMFYEDTHLISAANLILPASSKEGLYNLMFYGCTNLTTAPVISLATLPESICHNMFTGCTSLNYIKCLATDISARNCTTDWVDGVSATGTFVKASSMTDWTEGKDGIPAGWTVQNA